MHEANQETIEDRLKALVKQFECDKNFRDKVCQEQ